MIKLGRNQREINVLAIRSNSYSRSDLFQEQAKFNELKKMERTWKDCQSELESLKVKYLLQGELGVLSVSILVTVICLP